MKKGGEKVRGAETILASGELVTLHFSAVMSISEFSDADVGGAPEDHRRRWQRSQSWMDHHSIKNEHELKYQVSGVTHLADLHCLSHKQ